MTATTMRLLEQLDELDGKIGDDSISAARVLTEDFLGVAVAGSRTREGRIIHRHAALTGHSGPCHVADHPETFDAPLAALVVGTSGYSIGLTDTHARSITHPGPSIVSAALAVAQATGASGKDMLRAVVLGCEAVIRIGSVVNPSHRARGYHPTATCNVFGVAVAAGRLLGLDRDQLANALGLAGSMSGGIYEFRHAGSMLMALHGGWPAQNGIVAARLAAQGFTGPATVLEGPEGFFRAFADETRPELLAVDLDHPGILEVGLRPYNACRYGHSGIDALREIAERRGPIDPATVEHVTVATHHTAVDQETEPTSVVGARLSTKFTVAYAIAHGPKLSEVDEHDLADDLVGELVARMDVVEDPELTAIFPEKWACRVTVRFTDGTRETAQVDVPKGEPANPMTPAEVAEKFHRLADPVLGLEQATVLERELLALPDAADVSRLSRALAGVRG
jgi:2-methylcitrate dehydratase PrpD